MSYGLLTVLEDARIPVKLKLSAAWAALMFLYAYGDVFAYFRPGFIEDVQAGEVFAFDIDQTYLTAISVYVAVPAVMVLASLLLPPRWNRRANVALGAVYALTILASVIGDDYVYYWFLSLVETAVAAAIVWIAWTWPRQPAA